MEKNIGKDILNKTQRESFLKDNCDKVEEKGYMKPFSPAQLQGHKESLANTSIRIAEIESEKKLNSEYYKGLLKPLIQEHAQMVSNIKAKAEYVREICYKYIDQESKEVGYYNAEGDLIEMRPATADELQPTLFTVRTGTHD